MKTKIIFVAFILLCQYALTQDKINIDKNTFFTTTDGVQVVLDDTDLSNDGVIKQSPGEGIFRFTGTRNTRINGRGIMAFDRILLDKSNGAELVLGTDLSISSLLEFANGKLNLTDHFINLDLTGRLKGESETAYAFTTGSGYLEARADLQRPNYLNPGNLGASISSPVSPGLTVIRRGHTSQLDQTGKSSALRYFDISPINNNALNATVRFDYFEHEVEKINESEAVLLKNEGAGNWMNIGYDQRDGSGNFLEKKGIDKFSRITISTSSPYISGKLKLNGSLSPVGKQTEEKLAFKLWPNPVISQATLSVDVRKSVKMRLVVFDAKGTVVKTQEQLLLSGKNQFQVDLSGLPQGNYSIRANWENNSRVIKLDKM